MQTLDQKLLNAHERKDGAALVTLYLEAANLADTRDAEGFYLTHAYIYALDIGSTQISTLYARLKTMGRVD